MEEFKVGNVYRSSNCGNILVLNNKSSRNVDIKFLDTGYTLLGQQRGNVVRGTLKDPTQTTVEGVARIGETKTLNVANTYAYKCWKKMIVRCYNIKYQEVRPTYIGCAVVDEWLNFSNFEPWFYENYKAGYSLDKDLLFKGNRTYSKDTCCFLPQEINTMITQHGRNIDGCESGVSRRRKKGSMDYNGILTVSVCGAYLGRFNCLDKANSAASEFRELYFESVAEKYFDLGLINEQQANALFSFLS